MSLLSDDFRQLVLNNTPLLDVRAPVEFKQGAFDNAFNIPILNDEERKLVGIRYKQEGNESAIKLAEELIRQEGKQERIALWKSFLKKYPKAYLYCFRGGQRSGITQSWLKEEGIEITRLKGGYKRFRSYLMEESLRISSSAKSIILGGRTGSGKTILLKEFENFIDLEGLANHRGSTFGSAIAEQPTQINFENSLAYKLIQFEAKNFETLIVEHESHNIGKAFIPKPLFHNLMDGELVILERPMDERLNIIYHEYVELAIAEHKEQFGNDGFKKWQEGVNQSLSKVQKRLGSELYIELQKIFDEACEAYTVDNENHLFKVWIEKLLTHYYDPMYDYQLEKTTIPIIFRGNAQDVVSFLDNIRV